MSRFFCFAIVIAVMSACSSQSRSAIAGVVVDEIINEEKDRTASEQQACELDFNRDPF